VSIPIGEKGETDMLIGELKDVMHFYAAVKIAIGKGELDAQIGKSCTSAWMSSATCSDRV
jgi:hypothetical protein